MRDFFRRRGKVTAEAARRITGVSTPVGGVQWADPGPSEAEIVRRFLIFLEDRRVLFNPFQLETEGQVEHSIHQIREECTKALQALPSSASACDAIRVIRGACRVFHDEQHEEFPHFDGDFHVRRGRPGFFLALGAFRATVGYQVAILAGRHNIDVEGDLASILPQRDSE
ncbi:DUF6650 family protein [Pelagibacterium sp.]|uniref:DUF6650 family protein n=1 Tax=Pelagibacterium sp. TaxID=1967288 RepID=UPI003BAD8BB3